jgi:hypothetical protein
VKIRKHLDKRDRTKYGECRASGQILSEYKAGAPSVPDFDLPDRRV